MLALSFPRLVSLTRDSGRAVSSFPETSIVVRLAQVGATEKWVTSTERINEDIIASSMLELLKSDLLN